MRIITQRESDSTILEASGYSRIITAGSQLSTPAEVLHSYQKELQDQDIILVSDSTEQGMALDKLAIKIFPHRVRIIDKAALGGGTLLDYYNDHGETGIQNLIRAAERKIEGLRDLSKDPYRGLQESEGRYIATGLPTIDHAINDLAPKMVTLVTGRSNDGKTTLVNQIVANAIDTGNSVFWMSGEGVQEIMLNRFYQAVIGYNSDNYTTRRINKREFKEPKKEVLQALARWHDKRLILFNKGDSDLKNTKQLFAIMAEQIKVRQVNLVVIDNLMSILSIERASEKWEAQADFMQRCADISKAYNTHIILVLHPNKTLQKGHAMEFEQIAGSSDLANKADNILFVRREFDPLEIAGGNHGSVRVLKNRYHSDLPEAPIYFDPDTGTLCEWIVDPKTNQRRPKGYIFRWKEYMEGKE